MARLALAHWNKGMWDEAEQLGMQVMETSKEGQHPDMLTIMNNLSFTWKPMDWHTEALNLIDERV